MKEKNKLNFNELISKSMDISTEEKEVFTIEVSKRKIELAKKILNPPFKLFSIIASNDIIYKLFTISIYIYTITGIIIAFLPALLNTIIIPPVLISTNGKEFIDFIPAISNYTDIAFKSFMNSLEFVFQWELLAAISIQSIMSLSIFRTKQNNMKTKKKI